MVSYPEDITDEGPSLSMTKTAVKKPTASKYLRLFTNKFDVKKRTAICCVGAAK